MATYADGYWKQETPTGYTPLQVAEGYGRGQLQTATDDETPKNSN